MFRARERSKNVRASGKSKKRPAIFDYILIFLIIGGFSFSLSLFHHRTEWLDKIHGFLLDKSAPLTLSVEKFSHSLHNLHEAANTLFTVSEILQECDRYRQESAYWESKAQSLAMANKKLRAVAKFVATYPKIKLATNLITYPHLPFTHRCTIGAGKDAQVQLNAAVISRYGVVGRTIKVNQHSAEVLLLTDASSRVPVYIESTDEHAILAGGHSDDPQLVLRQKESLIPTGSRIVTSGKCGLFNPGLLIGYTHKEGSDLVTLAQSNLDNIDTVFVLERYDVND